TTEVLCDPPAVCSSQNSDAARTLVIGARSLRLFDGSHRDAFDAVGAARIEGAFGDEGVVVGARLPDPEARGLDRLQVAVTGDRARDAGSPEFDVAPGALLERPAADDV